RTHRRNLPHRRAVSAQRGVSRLAGLRPPCGTPVGERRKGGRERAAGCTRGRPAVMRGASDDTRAWRVFRILSPLVVAAIVLAAWQAWVTIARIPQYLVPSPLVVAQTLYADRALLAHSLGITLGVALAALALATLVGVAAALLFAQSRWIEASLFPYAILLQVTPIVSIAPLIIIWVRNTWLALVICATVV